MECKQTVKNLPSRKFRRDFFDKLCKALPRHAAGCRKNRQFAQNQKSVNIFPRVVLYWKETRPGFSGTQRRNAL